MRLGDQAPYVCCGDGIVNGFRKQVAVYFDICQQVRMALKRGYNTEHYKSYDLVLYSVYFARPLNLQLLQFNRNVSAKTMAKYS